jgi:hypothetical protein
MKRSLRKMSVALMMVNLMVRTPESIVSMCKHSDMMYASIEQFYSVLNEACGRSNNREN